MFVERITRYNFDIETEFDEYKKYAQMLGDGWYTEVMGKKIISLVHHISEEYGDSSENETCKECQNICVMYEPDMKRCKAESEGKK